MSIGDQVAGFTKERPFIALLFAVLVLSNVWWAVDSWISTRELREAREAQSDLLLDVAEADSVITRIGEENDDLFLALQDSSEKMRRLARNLDATQSDNARLTRLLANAQSEITDTGTVTQADTVVRECEECLYPGDSVTGHIEDGPFTLDWTFYAMNRLEARMRAEIRAQMVSVELPDDRLVVFAESDDPAVNLQVERFEFTPPERPEVGFHFGTAWKVGLVALPTGAFLWELAR